MAPPPAWTTGPPAYRGPVGPPAGGGATAHRTATPPRRRQGIGWVWVGVAVGTAVAAGLDRIVGGVDGRPALFLLVIFALPFWDTLSVRVPAGLAVLAGMVVAVAALWLAIALARPEGWWRGEVAFGLACAIVGTVHGLVTARRTVER
jgi:hypothetical protein